MDFAAGVPDSLLEGLSESLQEEFGSDHLVACNEGSAISIAVGSHLGSGNVPVVYMQNSGIGNAVNPLVSLAHEKVWGIPILLIIGWRGEISDDDVQIADEPQHSKQGYITLPLLKSLDIDYLVCDKSTRNVNELAFKMVEAAKENAKPVALVCRKGFFVRDRAAIASEPSKRPTITRAEVLTAFIDGLPDDTINVATTGYTSRELFELRSGRGKSSSADLLVIGGMGHASAIAYGIARKAPSRRVVCFDGDGALLMHMGGMLHAAKAKNLVHVLFNNGVHDSVGGIWTDAKDISFSSLASAAGYNRVATVESLHGLFSVIQEAASFEGSFFIEVKCSPSYPSSAGRPNRAPRHNKEDVMLDLVGHRPSIRGKSAHSLLES
ncbi:phosphonopyruvate decarboxylase [Methylobacterium radiotolerans]|uniref:Phosphonopyruvate decarboxylase n=1 Tax=Methylobacterium radiotolerans TaxID=31998 RepID=A0ABV2NTA9_9HYPH